MEKVTLEEKKEIAVLIPAYNAETTIVRAIDSVKQQTYPYWKVYVIDDNSEDNTINVIKEMAYEEPRIIVLSSLREKGKTCALRFGIDHIRNADYIMFLDSDDWLKNTELFKILMFEMSNEKAECICFNYLIKGKLGFPKLSEKIILLSNEEYLKNILNRQYMDGNLWSGIYQYKRVKEGFSVQKFDHEDYRNKYDIIKDCDKIIILPIVGYEYYTNPDGITHKAIQDKDKYYYIHAKEFTNNIMTAYPALRLECDYFVNWVLLWTISRLADCKDAKKMDMYVPMMREAKRNFRVFMKNRYFSGQDRITYLLIRFKVYRTAHKIYQKIKKCK